MLKVTQTILDDIEGKGWSSFSTSKHSLDNLFEVLGHIIMETAVSIDRKSRPLVTSAEGLSPHTDHHLAHYILWHCIVQDSRGVHSIIVDGLNVFRSMNPETQEMLRHINLMEHSVFKNDLEHHSLISETSIGDRIYYPILFNPTEFWLAGERLTKEQKQAFNAFNAAVRGTKSIRLKLEPGECLVVDNGRILHGRTPLSNNSDRLLKRYWIGDSLLEKISSR